MKLHKKLLFAAGISLFLLSGVAYASSQNFQSQAQKFINENCGKKLISNQTALLCYLFYKTQEHDQSLNTINTTLSPIPTEIQNLQNQQGQLSQNINSLQSSTSTIAATIENLKSTQGKSVHVFDANNQDLGFLITGGYGGLTEVFNTTTGLLIDVGQGGTTIGEDDPLVLYTTSNCTGTPYFSLRYVGNLFQASGQFVKADTSTPAATLDIHSDKGLNESQASCLQNSNFGSMSNLYPLIQVNNPYQNPVTPPLQYKLQ